MQKVPSYCNFNPFANRRCQITPLSTISYVMVDKKLNPKLNKISLFIQVTSDSFYLGMYIRMSTMKPNLFGIQI